MSRPPRDVGLAHRLLLRLTEPPLLTVFAAAQLVLTLAVVAPYVASLEGPTDAAGKVVTGDFIAFIGAARMLADGRGGDLYQLDAQRSEQARLLGRELTVYQPYAYPPLLALLLAPLAGLPFLWSFHLFGVAQLALLLHALCRLRPALAQLGHGARGWATAALLVVGFQPVAHTALGGQTSALSLALCCLLVAALRMRRPLWAGLWLGLLCYKPQLALLPACALLACGERRALATAALVAALHYALGAVVCGADWPLAMLAMLGDYRSLELSSNAATHIALLPFFDALVGGVAGLALGALAALGVALLALLRLRSAGARDAGALALLWLATMLSSPHLQYYDLALVALPMLLIVEGALASGRPVPRVAVLATYLGYPLHGLAAMLGFQPLTLLVGWLGALSWLSGRGYGAAGTAPGDADAGS